MVRTPKFSERPTSDARLPAARSLVSAVVILAGAGVYAMLEATGALEFSATPLILGLTAVVAGLAGTRHRVTATGLALAGWGTAVLLVAHGVIPAARTTPAYMLGMGVGLLVAAAVAPRSARGDWLASAVVVTVTGPLSLYATYDVAALGRWRFWAGVLLAWTAWEAFWGWRADLHPPEAAAVGHV